MGFLFRVLLKITPSQLLDEYLAVALTKVENELTPLAEKSFVLDLCVAFTKYLTEKQIERLYQKVAEFFTSEITTSLQKKSFRVLEEICCSETDGCVGYVATHLDDLKELLTADLRVASPAAKGCRLQSIFGLLKVLGEKDVNFVKSTVPAITFCLKENNSKTRKRAAVVLVGIIKFLKDHVGGVNSAVMTLLNELDSYVTGSSGQETAACLIATRLILYEFRLELSSDTLSRMIHLAMEKTTEEQRPVVQSAIEFLSTAVGCCSDVTVRMYLGEILGCLFQQTSDCQNHFRFLTRKVLIKLAKKFGAEVLTKFIPEAYQKQLAYVRKFCQRQEHKVISLVFRETNF